MRPFVITESIHKTKLPIKLCGCVEPTYRSSECGCTAKCNCRNPNAVYIDDIKIRLQRVGEEDTIYEYPAHEVDQEGVTFMWDDLIHKAKKGRYQGIVYIPNCEPMCVPFFVGCTCSMNYSENPQKYYFTKECTSC